MSRYISESLKKRILQLDFLIQEKILGMTILRLNMVSFMPKQILQKLQLKY
jgi:hypothetical protein